MPIKVKGWDDNTLTTCFFEGNKSSGVKYAELLFIKIKRKHLEDNTIMAKVYITAFGYC